MKERKLRWSSPLVRGIAVLGAVLIAAGALSPAFGAQAVTKKKAKRIAKNQINALVPGLINQQVPGLIDSATLEQGTIPAVTMSTSDADKTVYTNGPFTITMDCSDVAGDVNLQLNVRTSEVNSVVDDGFGNILGDIDPADGDVEFHEFTGNPPGGDAVTYYAVYYANLFLKAPSGTHKYVAFLPITNYTGNHCYVDGFFFELT